MVIVIDIRRDVVFYKYVSVSVKTGGITITCFMVNIVVDVEKYAYLIKN